MIKLPPKEIMIAALKEAVLINWKNTFEHIHEDERKKISVDWIESIKYKKLDQAVITKISKKIQQEKKLNIGRFYGKIGFENL